MLKSFYFDGYLLNNEMNNFYFKLGDVADELRGEPPFGVGGGPGITPG
jgi:hypothetical protein